MNMKRFVLILMLLALCAALTACGSKEPEPEAIQPQATEAVTEATAQTVAETIVTRDPLATPTAAPEPKIPDGADAAIVAAVQSAASFEELTPLKNTQILSYLYLDQDQVSDMAMSIDASRATAEMIVVLTASDDSHVQTLADALDDYRTLMLEQYKDYRPDEAPKLEGAVLKTKGRSVALIVGKDAAAAEQALDAAW